MRRLRDSVRTALRRAAPAWLRNRVGYSKAYRRITSSPDRVMLVEDILPRIAEAGGDILWVGVRRYTQAYPAILEACGGTCWSLELDPTYALWGAPGRHVTADLLTVADIYPAERFDAVLVNGVYGHGINSLEQQAAGFEAMARVTAPGGLLLLGWNTDAGPDPLAGGSHLAWWEPTAFGGLPPRRSVSGVTHIYDLLRRR